MMKNEILIDAIKSLTPEEQTAVLEFIDHLKHRNVPSSSPFFQAADQFIAEHSELLQRVASDS